jgi:hypothetical protein
MAEDGTSAELSPQALALYSRMLEDATFIKRQQWATTNYAVLIYAAIIWLTKNITLTEWTRWLLTAFRAGGAIAVVGLLTRFQIDLWKLRERIADANNYSFGAAEKSAFGIKRAIQTHLYEAATSLSF